MLTLRKIRVPDEALPSWLSCRFAEQCNPSLRLQNPCGELGPQANLRQKNSPSPNEQFTLAELPRQSVYSRLAGYEDLNDAERLAADPTFRSQRIWDRGAALTSTLHWYW